jgi:Rrf2 family protein
MKLSRTAGYALQATLQLAQAGSLTPVPCSQLAAEGGMPERFLLQILRNLVTHGILHSARGVDGGYTLDRPPDQISILQVIEAVDGPLSAAVPESERFPEQSQAKLREALDRVTSLTRQQLDQIKIACLLDKTHDA